MAELEWHAMEMDGVVDALKSDITKGLSSNEAAKRLEKWGPNSVLQRAGTSPFMLFAEQFKDFMVMVLLAATVVSGFLGEIEDAITIFAIVILNAVLGFIQEFRAEKSLAALKEMAAPTAKVLRDGRISHIASSEVVPGDIILLETGDRVPADARLIESVGIEIDEAALTGESIPVSKGVNVLGSKDIGLGDRRNMAFASTVVTQGRGRAVVTATGMLTELGKIAKMIREAEDEETPLQRRLERLGKSLVWLCLGLCAMVVAAGVLRGEPWDRMFLTGVSLAVAAIPEGLPAIVTIALAIGVQRMIRRNAIIRKLPAVETLGCTTVICSDKTGTLTQNAMTVTRLWAGGCEAEVTGTGYEPSGKFIINDKHIAAKDHPDFKSVLEICGLCNNSSIFREDSTSGIERLKRVFASGTSRWRVEGDPTEGALITVAQKAGISISGSLLRYKRIYEIPFTSERKMMSVICEDPKGKRALYLKGAPDVVLGRCGYILVNGRIEPMTAGYRDKILSVNERYANMALRVLALAFKEVQTVSPKNRPEDLERNLVFAGLAGMIDPPREEAKTAIRLAKTAGIKTVMITGDHRATASAVAKELGLMDQNSKVLTGEDLERISDRELDRAVSSTSVYARVSPKHKLRIVKAWKRKGHIVAMTGDGVNDAPAVKEADIGVSMGVSGTDVTKEASAMILTDDNFATIVAAVEEGRSIYANIRKFIRYLLACNIGEVLTMFFATIIGLPLPLLPMQILWTNLVTDGLPALALGVEPTEKGIMEQPPRDPSEGVFSGGLQIRILVQGVAIAICTIISYIVGLYSAGGSLERGRTLAFATLVLSQLIFVFNCRSERKSVFQLGLFTNLYLILAVLTSLGMQLIVMYIPFLQRIFETVALPGRDWLVVILLSGSSTVLNGFARWFKRVFLRRVVIAI